jgi:hypothetical protein
MSNENKPNAMERGYLKGQDVKPVKKSIFTVEEKHIIRDNSDFQANPLYAMFIKKCIEKREYYVKQLETCPDALVLNKLQGAIVAVDKVVELFKGLSPQEETDGK